MSDFGDLPVEEFRRQAQAVTAWVAEYLEEIETRPVMSRVRPGEVRRALPDAPPAEGESLDDILADFREVIAPGMTHWNHPSFHAYFSNTGSIPGILAETLIAAMNVNAMLWRTAPAATELEFLTCDWLRQMMDLPAGFEGHINDTASLSTVVALAAAREQATGGAVRDRGLVGGPRLRIYASTEAHNSVDKAALLLGLGREGVGAVPVDEDFALRPDELARRIAEDRAEGWTPMAVVATVGTTSTTAMDPVPAVAEICRGEGVWLHVDAAYGGAMAVVPEFRPLFAGCEAADSLVVNPHKWLFTPMDCSVLFTTRPQTVRAAFSLVPAYLWTPEDDERNLMNYGPALGRRFRALKLWMVIRAYGAEGIARRVREHVRLAHALAGWVDAAPEWERLAPAPMATVVFRHVPPGVTGEELDAHNRGIIDRINAGGRAFLSHTQVRGALGIRVSIGNIRTTAEDVERVWRLLREAASA